MPKRYANHRLVKIHRSYSVEEVADTLDVHKNTVRTWVKNGLLILDSRRPSLILGLQLVEFLKARRTRNKRPCKPGELYCFRCRMAKAPAGAMADCLPVSDKIGHLKALCPDCFCMMNRRVSLAKLGQLSGILSIKFPMAQEQVSDTTQPNVNNDFEQGA
uniref:Helix-turn-helix domain-containing protein n=1 Tax=mine drainage metagenome TaxID=410659 RepID=E6QLL8_9ZZZZ